MCVYSYEQSCYMRGEFLLYMRGYCALREGGSRMLDLRRRAVYVRYGHIVHTQRESVCTSTGSLCEVDQTIQRMT